MSEKQIKLNVSWIVPWTAGFLFTVGFIDSISFLTVAGEGTGKILGGILALFLGWPIVLGAHLGGNL